MKKFNRMLKDFVESKWKLGLAVGAAVGVFAMMVNLLSSLLNWLPAKTLQIFSTVVPAWMLQSLDSFFPIIFYAYCGALGGWVWENRKNVFDVSIYTENKSVGLALAVLLVLPLIGMMGNSFGLWCAGCGTGTLEVSVTSGGTPVGNGLANCILSETSGNLDQWTQSVSGGRAVFQNFGAGITYDLRCYCIANPTGSGVSTQHVYFYDGMAVSKTASIDCGGTCTVTNTCALRKCYLDGMYCYDNCNVITGNNLCLSDQLCMTMDNVAYCSTSGTGTTNPLPHCNQECTDTQVNNCVDEYHICLNQWDLTINGYCRKIVYTATDCQQGTTTTIVRPPDKCTPAGVCSGDYKCVRQSAGNLDWVWSTDCVSPTTTLFTTTTLYGVCNNNGVCERLLGENVMCGDCLTQCGNGLCDASLGETQITCPRDCKTPDYTLLLIIGVIAVVGGVLLYARKTMNGGTQSST